MERTFFSVLILKALVGLHRTVQLQLLPHCWLGIDLDYCNIELFGRNDAKAETPVLWPPHAKGWLIEKDWCWEGLGQAEKGTTEDEMAGWHHWLDGCESEWTPGVGDGQGGLVCCDSWGCKQSDMTDRLNWSEMNWEFLISSDIWISLAFIYWQFKNWHICPCIFTSLSSDQFRKTSCFSPTIESN